MVSKYIKGLNDCKDCGYTLFGTGVEIKQINTYCSKHIHLLINKGTKCVPESVGAKGKAGPTCDKGDVGKEFR